jgi:hypothetical protein
MPIIPLVMYHREAVERRVFMVEEEETKTAVT